MSIYRVNWEPYAIWVTDYTINGEHRSHPVFEGGNYGFFYSTVWVADKTISWVPFGWPTIL